MMNDYGKDEAAVESHGPVTLLGRAPCRRADLDWALARAPTLVAADGGAETAISFGRTPDRVIGDMDSLSGAVARALPPGSQISVSDQDTTDFEKCLDRIRAPLVIGLGVLGRRIDHTLAALSCIARRDAACLLVGPDDVAFAAPLNLTLDLPPGCRVSLFPMTAVTGRSSGLEWPIDGIPFAPGGRIGTSNRATGPVSLALDGPGMLILLPADQRDAAWNALSNSER